MDGWTPAGLETGRASTGIWTGTGVSTCICETATCARAAGTALALVEATEAEIVPSLPPLVGPPSFGEFDPATIPAHDFR